VFDVAKGSGTARAGVLCVGLTTLDVVHHLDGAPRWGTKQRSVGGELLAGGPAANAAVTAARLLGSARLLTAVGTLPGSDAARADLAAHGVGVIDLAPPGWALPAASALVDVRTGERTVVSPGALGGRAVDGAQYSLAGLLDGIGVVLLDGHHPRLAARVAAEATHAGVPVVLDAGSWKEELDPVLPRVTVSACSADLRPPGGPRAGDDPVAVATALHRRGVASVLVTDGPRPVVWSTLDGGRGSVAVPAVRAVDTLGAGDAFHGALAAALLGPAGDLPRCAELAARVAAVRCAHLGSRAWLAEPALDPVADALADALAARASRRRAGR
jgi:sugar/nucleoside kinase (ribokinase family)